MDRILIIAICAAITQAWTGHFTVKVRLQDQLYKDGTVYLYWQQPTMDSWRWNVYRQSAGGEWQTLCSFCPFQDNFEVKGLDTNLSYAFKVHGLSKAANGVQYNKDTADSDTFRVVPKYRVDVATLDSEMAFSTQSPVAAFKAINQTPLWTEGRITFSDTLAYRVRDLKGDMVWKTRWSGLILPDSRLDNLEIGWNPGECREARLFVTYRLYFRLDSIPDQQVDTVALKPECASGLRPAQRRPLPVPATGKAGYFDAAGRIHEAPARPSLRVDSR